MEAHIADLLHSAGTIIAIIGFMWKMRRDISTEIDTKLNAFESRLNQRFDAIDARFDRLEERMARIEQNHLDHITTLHAVPSTPPVKTEETP